MFPTLVLYTLLYSEVSWSYSCNLNTVFAFMIAVCFVFPCYNSSLVTVWILFWHQSFVLCQNLISSFLHLDCVYLCDFCKLYNEEWFALSCILKLSICWHFPIVLLLGGNFFLSSDNSLVPLFVLVSVSTCHFTSGTQLWVFPSCEVFVPSQMYETLLLNPFHWSV